jgi:hypothetical protein
MYPCATWKGVPLVKLSEIAFAEFEAWVKGVPDPETGIRIGQAFRDETSKALSALLSEKRRREGMSKGGQPA